MTDAVTNLKIINKKDNWMTPKNIYDKLDKIFQFTLDPCPVNPTFDGLHIKWSGSVFVNPPYSEVEKWVAKAVNEICEGNVETVVFLVYAKTDTKWFHKYVWKNKFPFWDIDFIKGRVKFVNPDGLSKNTAPYPSMILIYSRKPKCSRCGSYNIYIAKNGFERNECKDCGYAP